MIHSIQEAREKWCPMVRYDGDNGGTFNRGISEPLNNGNGRYVCNCIADECMWWKWDGDLSGYCGKVGR